MTTSFPRVSLNCDMGEGYYKWRMGPDEELFPLIDYCNIACGFHASDHGTMLRMVRLAKKHNVGIGAHPGLDDVKGFGRRMIPTTPEEVYSLALYQLGALKAMVLAEGCEFTHVKPHAALYFMTRDDPEICRSFLKAHIAVSKPGPPPPLLGLPGTQHEAISKELGVPFVAEMFVDIDYDAKGSLIPMPESNPPTQQGIAAKVASLLASGETTDKEGKKIKLTGTDGTFTICLHSDMPTALANMKGARAAVDAAAA